MFVRKGKSKILLIVIEGELNYQMIYAFQEWSKGIP